MQFLPLIFYLFLGIPFFSTDHLYGSTKSNLTHDYLRSGVENLNVLTLMQLDYLRGSTLDINPKNCKQITDHPHFWEVRLHLLELIANWQKDPSVICRHPATYEVLRKSIPLQSQLPKVEEICPNIIFFNKNVEKVILPYKNIVGFDYVLGGRGEQQIARFGHTMLRLRYCAPTISQEDDPDQTCQENPLLAQIFGFVAENTGGVFSLTGAVTGEYPAHLILESDIAIHNRYLTNELRDIHYNPLKLDEEQKVLLFYALAEKFWIPSGKYRFFSTNCAGEMLKLLKFAIGDPLLHSLEYSIITPMKLRKKLLKLSYLNEGTSQTLHAIKNVNEELVRILFASRVIPVKSFARYKRTSSKERNRWIEQGKKTEKFIYHMAWLKLEQIMLAEQSKKKIAAINEELAKDKNGRLCPLSFRRQLDNSATARNILSLRKAQISGVPAPNDLYEFQTINMKISQYHQAMKKIQTCAHLYPTVYEIDQEMAIIQKNIYLLSTF